jgi:hypothetical protein
MNTPRSYETGQDGAADPTASPAPKRSGVRLLAALATAALLASDLTTGAGQASAQEEEVRLELAPSSPTLAACMPGASLAVIVDRTTDENGFDSIAIRARHLPADRDFTVFLLQQAGAPFGAAQYIGDFRTNESGNGRNLFKLVVAEAFASTIVDGHRTRVDLNRIGVWFADPADDDFCLGSASPVTPFDGDNAAGVQAFNSAAADPLPAP